MKAILNFIILFIKDTFKSVYEFLGQFYPLIEPLINTINSYFQSIIITYASSLREFLTTIIGYLPIIQNLLFHNVLMPALYGLDYCIKGYFKIRKYSDTFLGEHFQSMVDYATANSYGYFTLNVVIGYWIISVTVFIVLFFLSHIIGHGLFYIFDFLDGSNFIEQTGNVFDRLLSRSPKLFITPFFYLFYYSYFYLCWWYPFIIGASITFVMFWSYTEIREKYPSFETKVAPNYKERFLKVNQRFPAITYKDGTKYPGTFLIDD